MYAKFYQNFTFSKKIVIKKWKYLLLITKRNEYLKPFVLTNVLREQLANLVDKSEGQTINLKPANAKIKHDKVSALIYGLYYCKLQEDKGKGRASRDLSAMTLFTKIGSKN